MDSNVITGINIALDSYGFLIDLFILVSFFVRQSSRMKKNIWIILTVVSLILWNVSDIFTWVCDGKTESWYPAGLAISTFIYYLCGYGILAFFAIYLLDNVGGYLIAKKYGVVILSSITMDFILLCLTPKLHLLYTIDENNHYSRGPYFFALIVLQLFMFGTVLLFVLRNRKIINYKRLYVHMTFLAIPQLMQILQLYFFGIMLISVGYSLALIIIFLDMNMGLEKVLDKSFEVVRQKDAKLIKIQNHTILSLSSLVEERDTDTGGHVQRTSDYVELLATSLMHKGYYKSVIDPYYINHIVRAAPMHDIGKIVVPDYVLKKPGRLTDEEFEIMKKHALEGGRIIREVLDESEDREYVRITIDIATYHHEKWDGTGYPRGLKSNQIPLSARIMALADVFDALVSPRVYKEPMSYEKAFEIIEKGSGTHFDPIIVEVCLKNKDAMIKVNESYIEAQKRHMNDASDNDIELLEELEEI